uniref:Uncharacterized protein n=1 Tax=Agrobacterium tumefaciens TaxID=358 RepID=A0A2Z2PZP7_AGRTU|nr:hypothetical protein [Agrobacterium radiobacter]
MGFQRFTPGLTIMEESQSSQTRIPSHRCLGHPAIRLQANADSEGLPASVASLADRFHNQVILRKRVE